MASLSITRRFGATVSTSIGAISVAIEIDGPAPGLDVAALEEDPKDLVKGYPVRVEVMDAIPLTTAGKNRVLVSDLDLNKVPAGSPD